MSKLFKQLVIFAAFRTVTTETATEGVFVSDPRFMRGTLVQFEIRKHSRSRLEYVFAEFAPEQSRRDQLSCDAARGNHAPATNQETPSLVGGVFV